jgi:hypothetical protein
MSVKNNNSAVSVTGESSNDEFLLGKKETLEE